MTITRRQLLENHGWSEFQLRQSRRQLQLTSVVPGWYREVDDGTSEPNEAWNSIARVLLDRGGPSAVLSHRAAAASHRFDLYTDNPRPKPEITVPYGSTFHPKGGLIHRTRNLTDLDVVTDVTHVGFPTTSKARTILDLSRTLSLKDLEIVVESALRSSVPTDPTAWDRDTLDRLEKLSNLMRPGSGKLRTVLRQRPPGCRPTGSIYETRGIQALRSEGLGHLDRQETLIVIDEESGETRTVYPDVGEYNLGVTVEFDSHRYHKDRREAERKRDNHIGKAVRILRFDYSVPLAQVAREVRAEINKAKRRQWPDPTWTVTREPNKTIVRIPRPTRS
jgi:hypothetical protein